MHPQHVSTKSGLIGDISPLELVTKVRDFFQVKELTLPGTWVLEIIHGNASFGHGCARTLHPTGDRGVNICLFQRSVPLSQHCSINLQKILSVPVHELTDGEISSIVEALGSMAVNEEFDIAVIRTMELNNRRVLFITGAWIRSNMRVMSVITCDPSKPHLLQEIYYAAIGDKFMQHLSSASQILRSICWV
jgi:hypothetical protein